MALRILMTGSNDGRFKRLSKRLGRFVWSFFENNWKILAVGLAVGLAVTAAALIAWPILGAAALAAAITGIVAHTVFGATLASMSTVAIVAVTSIATAIATAGLGLVGKLIYKWKHGSSTAPGFRFGPSTAPQDNPSASLLDGQHQEDGLSAQQDNLLAPRDDEQPQDAVSPHEDDLSTVQENDQISPASAASAAHQDDTVEPQKRVPFPSPASAETVSAANDAPVSNEQDQKSQDCRSRSASNSSPRSLTLFGANETPQQGQPPVIPAASDEQGPVSNRPRSSSTGSVGIFKPKSASVDAELIFPIEEVHSSSL